MNDLKLGDDLKLALNRWEKGQILMPAHFEAQEDALLGTIVAAAELRGLPFYGIGRLEWEPRLLAKGTLHISRLSAVFLSGDLIAVPGNATLPDFDLPASGGPVEVYLRLLNETTDATGLDLYRGDSKDVKRVIRTLSLSTSISVSDAGSSLKLAVVEKAKAGWRLVPVGGDGLLPLVPSYIPPLLEVGTNPFLTDLLAGLETRLKELQVDLREQLKNDFFRGESMTTARRCQLAAYRLRALLADQAREVHPHPYIVLEAMRAFYAEVCVLQNVEPEDFDPDTYDHNDLSTCFSRMARRITSLLTAGVGPSPSLSFTRKDDDSRWIASPFPDQLVKAAEVYLVVQRLEPYAQVPLHGVKLASPSRLEVVHGRALPGVRFKPVKIGFPHTFGPDVDMYRLEPGDDWTYAVRESALACYVQPAIETVKMALFWRTP